MAGKFLDALDSVATLDAGLAFESVTTASDGTRKIIFRLTDGPGRDKTVETVVIPMRSNNRIRHERYTLCVSSQVGCGMNCQFCYTGRMGLMADLLPNQIVGQLVEARRLLAAEGDPSPISHVVYMGMGEPMANYDAMRVSLRLITCPEGLRVGKANVTVSSVGLVPEIQRYATEEESLLAISLHATTDEVRSWLVPVNRRYPLDELTAMLAKHFPRTTPTGGKPDKFCVIEYVMLEGVNDHVDDAERLLRLTDNVYCIINLIQFNAHAGATQFKPSSRERMLLFRDLLKKGGRVSTIRFSKGDDSMAACGESKGQHMSRFECKILQNLNYYEYYKWLDIDSYTYIIVFPHDMMIGNFSCRPAREPRDGRTPRAGPQAAQVYAGGSGGAGGSAQHVKRKA